MGKNRNSNNNSYMTGMGVAVDTDGHSERFMQKLEDNIDTWLMGYVESIIHKMSPEEIHYLIDHMQLSDSDMVPSGHLTRLERKSHSDDLKEGDLLKNNNLFRSFSREPSSSDEILGIYRDMGEGIDDFVIYRTVGQVPFFDPSKFSNPFPYQTEAFVPVDSMRVSEIHTVTDSNELAVLTDINQNIPEGKSVKVIDIVYDPSIRSVPVTLVSGETTINLH